MSIGRLPSIIPRIASQSAQRCRSHSLIGLSGNVRVFPAMQKIAEAAIVIAAGLSGAGHVRRSRHVAVLGAVACWVVRVAPPHVQDFGDRISVRLATGTDVSRHNRRIGKPVLAFFSGYSVLPSKSDWR